MNCVLLHLHNAWPCSEISPEFSENEALSPGKDLVVLATAWGTVCIFADVWPWKNYRRNGALIINASLWKLQLNSVEVAVLQQLATQMNAKGSFDVLLLRERQTARTFFTQPAILENPNSMHGVPGLCKRRERIGDWTVSDTSWQLKKQSISLSSKQYCTIFCTYRGKRWWIYLFFWGGEYYPF